MGELNEKWQQELGLTCGLRYSLSVRKSLQSNAKLQTFYSDNSKKTVVYIYKL